MNKALEKLKQRLIEGFIEILMYLLGLYILISILIIVIGVSKNDGQDIKAGIFNLLIASLFYLTVNNYGKIKSLFKRIIENIYKYLLNHKSFIFYRSAKCV